MKQGIWRAAFVALISVVATSNGSASEEDLIDARLGCWREDGGQRVLMLEFSRAGWWENGKPRFFRASYTEAGATFETWGAETVYEFKLDGEQLQVVGAGKDIRMNRIEAAPEGLLVPPYELNELVEVNDGLVKALTEDLLRRRNEDQRVRGPEAERNGYPDMQRVDRDNTEFLRNIIVEMGWIDATRFGRQASEAAFLIVQHTDDLRLMRTALPYIEKDAKAGLVSGQNFALLYDRSQLNLGYVQRYGSQIGVQKGVSLLMACEDIVRVDEFRAEMGMGSLGEYLGYFHEEGDPPIRHVGAGQYEE